MLLASSFMCERRRLRPRIILAYIRRDAMSDGGVNGRFGCSLSFCLHFAFRYDRRLAYF